VVPGGGNVRGRGGGRKRIPAWVWVVALVRSVAVGWYVVNKINTESSRTAINTRSKAMFFIQPIPKPLLGFEASTSTLAFTYSFFTSRGQIVKAVGVVKGSLNDPFPYLASPFITFNK
jgi:hypothetical protein